MNMKAYGLNASQLKTIEQRLQARELQLQQEVDRAASEVKAEMEADLGAGENVARALVHEATLVDRAEIERDRDELKSIQMALRRIAEGNYGPCGECGADIPLERLLAQPEALRCMACQTRFERSAVAPSAGKSL